jgi:hypothetical protein
MQTKIITHFGIPQVKRATMVTNKISYKEYNDNELKYVIISGRNFQDTVSKFYHQYPTCKIDGVMCKPIKESKSGLIFSL